MRGRGPASLTLPSPREDGEAGGAAAGQPTDAQVIAEALVEPQRFAVLFDRHWTRVHRYCISRAGEAGEDLAADTFRVGFERRSAFDLSRPDARPWLFGIATNLVRSYLRGVERGRRATSRLPVGTQGDMTDDAIGRAEAELLGPRLTAALAGIGVGDRDALILHAWEALTYEQIGEALGIPVGTVRSRIHRARTRLRHQLQDVR